jgi:hypothetical protein
MADWILLKLILTGWTLMLPVQGSRVMSLPVRQQVGFFEAILLAVLSVRTRDPSAHTR